MWDCTPTTIRSPVTAWKGCREQTLTPIYLLGHFITGNFKLLPRYLRQVKCCRGMGRQSRTEDKETVPCTAGKTTALASCECQLELTVLHFWSCCLLVHLGKQPKMARLPSTWKNRLVASTCPGPGCYGPMGDEPINASFLSFSDSAFCINKVTKKRMNGEHMKGMLCASMQQSCKVWGWDVDTERATWK